LCAVLRQNGNSKISVQIYAAFFTSVNASLSAINTNIATLSATDVSQATLNFGYTSDIASNNTLVNDLKTEVDFNDIDIDNLQADVDASETSNITVLSSITDLETF
jgi:hypothetical protein